MFLNKPTTQQTSDEDGSKADWSPYYPSKNKERQEEKQRTKDKEGRATSATLTLPVICILTFFS